MKNQNYMPRVYAQFSGHHRFAKAIAKVPGCPLDRKKERKNLAKVERALKEYCECPKCKGFTGKVGRNIGRVKEWKLF